MLVAHEYSRSTLMTRRRTAMSALANGARRVFALLLVASVMLGVFFSGRSYFFCVAVQKVVEDACEDCPTCGDESDQGPRIGEGCCEEHQIGKLPRANIRIKFPRVLPAQVAVLPNEVIPAGFVRLRRPLYASAAPRIVARPALIRAGPSSSAERCIALQVFHC